MRFYWQDNRTRDVRCGAPIRGLAYDNDRPKRCLILIHEFDSIMDQKGMGEYIAYKNQIQESLTPKGVIEVVESYPEK
jgi:hypothetical protein